MSGRSGVKQLLRRGKTGVCPLCVGVRCSGRARGGQEVTHMTAIANLEQQSFFACVDAFKDGTDSPSAFLERCIAAIEAHESQVGAFVETNFEAARVAAAASTERWRTGQTLSLIDG